jgi:FMN phosphatase YigB (HAD superfamily)
MIDTITFDLRNTLIYNTPLDTFRYKEMRLVGILGAFKSEGVTLNYNELEKAYDQSFLECEKFWVKDIDLDTNEQLRILLNLVPQLHLKDFGQNLMDKISQAYTDPIIYDPPDLVENTREILQYLKEKECKIGLICNTGRTPGPEIFVHTLKELKSSPSNSIHIGDVLNLDVLGAKNAGMKAIHLNKNNCDYSDIKPDFSIKELRELKGILGRMDPFWKSQGI